VRGLYVFTHDCRLHDNRLLKELVGQVDELICLYILDTRFLHHTLFQTTGLSLHRQLFLLQTLKDLSRQLESLGQRLIVRVGDSHKIIPQWVQRYSIERMAMTFHPGVYEQDLRNALALRLLSVRRGGRERLREDQYAGVLQIQHHWA